jgi:hypothetical protein
MSKFKITCRCLECGNKYHFFAPSAAVPDEPCPQCGTQKEHREFDLAAGRAPSVVGANPAVKAMDIAADITMADHGLTDLKSDGRQGATMAPNLRPDLQQAADNMFTGKLGPGAGRMNPIQQRMRQLAAMARTPTGMGAFAAMKDPSVPDPIAMVQAPRTRPNVTLLNSRDAKGNVIS